MGLAWPDTKEIDGNGLNIYSEKIMIDCHLVLLIFRAKHVLP